MIKTNYLTEQTLNKVLDRLSDITVCTIGDMCLDYYLYADMKLSSLSRETPHYPLPIVKEVISPGGGGNVVNNIGALKVKKLLPVSLVGNDWRGVILKNFFKENADSINPISYTQPSKTLLSV